MKKVKKHKFAYRDPERETPTETTGTSSKQTLKENDYIKKDLKMTFVIISFLGFLLAGLYYLQTKTDFLRPVFEFIKF